MTNRAERLDELLALATEVGRTAARVARTQDTHDQTSGWLKRETYESLRRAKKEHAHAEAALAKARARFLASEGGAS